MARYSALGELRNQAVAAIATGEEGAASEEDVKAYFSKLEKQIVRGRIIAKEPRIDGRNNETVRPISVEV
ncbi:hypothetical protein, partial [Oleiphilus sp. HI0125]